MPRLSDTAPPRLLSSELRILSEPDPFLGLLSIETDDGKQDLAINVTVAAELFDLLEQFLERSGE